MRDKGARNQKEDVLLEEKDLKDFRGNTHDMGEFYNDVESGLGFDDDISLGGVSENDEVPVNRVQASLKMPSFLDDSNLREGEFDRLNDAVLNALSAGLSESVIESTLFMGRNKGESINTLESLGNHFAKEKVNNAAMEIDRMNRIWESDFEHTNELDDFIRESVANNNLGIAELEKSFVDRSIEHLYDLRVESEQIADAERKVDIETINMKIGNKSKLQKDIVNMEHDTKKILSNPIAMTVLLPLSLLLVTVKKISISVNKNMIKNIDKDISKDKEQIIDKSLQSRKIINAKIAATAGIEEQHINLGSHNIVSGSTANRISEMRGNLGRISAGRKNKVYNSMGSNKSRYVDSIISSRGGRSNAAGKFTERLNRSRAGGSSGRSI